MTPHPAATTARAEPPAPASPDDPEDTPPWEPLERAPSETAAAETASTETASTETASPATPPDAPPAEDAATSGQKRSAAPPPDPWEELPDGFWTREPEASAPTPRAAPLATPLFAELQSLFPGRVVRLEQTEDAEALDADTDADVEVDMDDDMDGGEDDGRGESA